MDVNFIHNYSDAIKSVIECHMPCGSFTVEYEWIGMGNVRTVHEVFLIRPKVKYSRSSPDTDKSARRVVRDEPDRLIQSRIPGPISDLGAVGTKIFDFEKRCDLEIGIGL